MSSAPHTDATHTIESLVDKYADDLIELRRDLHAHPELSWTERRTSGVIADRLTEAGLRVERVTETGVVLVPIRARYERPGMSG